MSLFLYLTIGICIAAQSAGADAVEKDLKALLSYNNLGMAAAGFGLAGAAHIWDDALRGELEGALLLEDISGLTHIYGESSLSLPAAGALWGVGEITGRVELAETGFALLRTLGFTQLAVAPLKLVVRRQRPDRSDHFSFPSGHTANSFAIARLMHRRHGQRVGLPLYVLGTLVAAGRIEDDLHFLSDVVMGGVLGLLVGNSVTWEVSDKVSVYPTPRGATLAITLD